MHHLKPELNELIFGLNLHQFGADSWFHQQQ
jgi:hypothetical protein